MFNVGIFTVKGYFRMRGKSKYFKRLLLSSIIVFIISFVSGTIIYRMSYDVLEEEISKSNYSSVSHFAKLFDQKLGEVYNIFSQMSLDSTISNTLVKDRIGSDISMSNILSCRRHLQSLQNDTADDIFIFMRNSNRMISVEHTTFSPDRYFYAYYDESPDEYNAFYSQLQKNNACYIHTVNGMDHIFIMQTIPVSVFKSESSVAIYSLDISYVTSLFHEWIPSAGVIFLVDNDNHVLLSSDISFNSDDLFSENNTISTAKNSVQSISMMLNGEEYMVQTVKSSFASYAYVFVMPSSAYYDKLDSLRVTSFSIFFIFMCIGLIISWMLSKRNYHPISEIVNDIQSNLPDELTASHPDDIDYIRSTFSNMISEKERTRCAIRDDLLGKILKGKYTSSKSMPLTDQFASVGIELISESFAVWLLKTYGDHDYEECDTYTDELSDVWEQYGHRAYRLRLNRDTHAYIVNISDSFPYNAEKIASEVLRIASNKFSLTCTISCGDAYSGIDGIYRSYTEVESSIEYSAVRGPGAFIHNNNVFKGNFRYQFSFRSTAEQLMLSYIKTGEPSAEEVMMTIKNNCCCGEIRLPDEFKCYYYDIVTLFMHIIDKLGLNNEILQDLQSCTDLIGFEDAAVELLSQLNELYVVPEPHDPDLKSAELCGRIKSYIIDNYSDPNLSLSSISAEFEFSEAYLTRVFRKVESTTIAVYISYLRIENAKRLLRDTTKTIADIALECGFTSSTAFIRLFKKHVGVTPGVYRINYETE